MSELDLKLKVASRRLLWRMGYTTRLDVPLRAFSAVQTQGAKLRSTSPQAFTDLDVLGLSIAGGFQIHSIIVDCKTSLKGSTERMFWVKGVSEFFDADAAYMVREKEVTEAARQLSSRLRISALTGQDVLTLESLHHSELPLGEEPYSWLFNTEHAARTLAAYNGLDKKLKRLLEYRQFDYWVYEEHRNPLQMVEHLKSSAEHLAPANPVHMSLVLDCAWLYLVSISRAIESLRAAHLQDLDLGLQMYLLGGPAGFQEKQQLSRLFKGLVENEALPGSVNVDPLPEYFGLLRELTTRIYRRPASVLQTLRVLEVATAASIIDGKASIAQVTSVDPIASKLAADVLGYLVAAAGLNPAFRSRGRSLLLNEDMQARSNLGVGGSLSSPSVSLPVQNAQPTVGLGEVADPVDDPSLGS